MKSVKISPVTFLVSVFLFTISLCSVSGGDPDTISPNYRSQQYKIYKDKTKPWIQSHELTRKLASQACAKKIRPYHVIKQHEKNNPYLIDPNNTFEIVPKRGNLKLRINRSIEEKTDEKPDQINAEGLYDLKQRENIEAIFQSLVYETDSQMTNLYDDKDVKANMEAVSGFSTSELQRNNQNNRLNNADKGFIDNSTLMARIADIFGPPPTGFNNLHFKRNIDKNEGSLQAAIYSYFGPEVLKSSVIRDGVSITSPMEDEGNTADNSGLGDRFPPFDAMVIKSGEDHKTRTTTQDSKPAEFTPEDSQHISRNRSDPGHPDSSGSGDSVSLSPKTQEVPIPPPTSSSSISLSSPLFTHDDVDDSLSSTSSVPNAIKPNVPSRNDARTPKVKSMSISSCLYYCLMAALVARL